VEGPFGRRLVDDYFDDEILELFYHEEKDGVAIIKDLDGVPYLDKISVCKDKQGTGLGKSLWDAVARKYPTLAWRARRDNVFNKFYFENCDGMVKGPQWVVYWKDLDRQKACALVDRIERLERTVI